MPIKYALKGKLSEWLNYAHWCLSPQFQDQCFWITVGKTWMIPMGKNNGGEKKKKIWDNRFRIQCFSLNLCSLDCYGVIFICDLPTILGYCICFICSFFKNSSLPKIHIFAKEVHRYFCIMYMYNYKYVIWWIHSNFV